MGHVYHQDIYDKGLDEVTTAATGGTLQMAICKGLPTSRAEVTADLTTTGKRNSPLRNLPAGEVTLANRGGGGREITIAAKATGNGTVVQTTVAGDDLFYAIIDGARLLVVLDEPSNQALTAGNELSYPQLKFGFGAP